MTQETIVVVFDTAARAGEAVEALEAAGVPAAAIERHAAGAAASRAAGATGTASSVGFWTRLFADQTTAEQNIVYERVTQAGGEVLTVALQDAERDGDRVMDILEQHHPVDVHERAATYAVSAQPPGAASAVGAPVSTPASEQVIQLSEEALAVGKRTVERGTTRVRRFVTSQAVKEDVTLRDEIVSVHRRLVTDGIRVGADAFTDRVIEMTESREEVVVAKTARVAEEVIVHKEVQEHVETVHENLRREELEVTKMPAAPTAGAGRTATDTAIPTFPGASS